MTALKNLAKVSFCLCIAFIATEAALLRVGATQTYKTTAAVASIVQAGDTVEIDSGTYRNDTATWRVNNLTLRSPQKFAHLIAPATIANEKSIWVVKGNNTVIENIEFSGATVPDQNGAGIRIEGGNITIRDCFFHDNEDGILGGDGSGCNVIIERTEFANNGYGDGYSHNLYIGHAASLTFRFNYTHHAKIGHTLKSRAQVNHILYNRIMDEADGTASYEVDLPNGGTSYLIGNIIQQGPETDNPTIVCYGEEGLTNTGKDLYVVNNTIVNDRSSGTFISIASGASRAKVINNLFVGSGTLISGPADTATNLSTTSPQFRNRAVYDYHPTAATPGIDRGSDPGSAGSYALAPDFMYRYDSDGEPRIPSGTIDIGAYEYNGAAVRRPLSATPFHNRKQVASGKVDLLGRSVLNKNRKTIIRGVHFPFVY